MTFLSKLSPILQARNIIHLLPRAGGISVYKPVRCYATEKGLSKSKERADVSTDVKPIGEKIKETTKTVSYTGVILAGVGVTGILFYYIFRELFSSNSPNSIYSVALEKCKNVSIFILLLLSTYPEILSSKNNGQFAYI